MPENSRASDTYLKTFELWVHESSFALSGAQNFLGTWFFFSGRFEIMVGRKLSSISNLSGNVWVLWYREVFKLMIFFKITFEILCAFDIIWQVFGALKLWESLCCWVPESKFTLLNFMSFYYFSWNIWAHEYLKILELFKFFWKHSSV